MANNSFLSYISKYFTDFKDSFFVIGGNACYENMRDAGEVFRTTQDYDIVLVADALDNDFATAIESFLVEGGYSNAYCNGHKTAYRFENPSNPLEYPKIIEFFIEGNVFPQSLDNRFAKISIKVNEEKISAMVLDKEIFDFANANTIEFDGVRFSSPSALIVLKTHAYFKNFELYKERKVKSNDYRKHRNDVLTLLGMMEDERFQHINDIPEVLRNTLNDFRKLIVSDKSIQAHIKTKKYNQEELLIIFDKIYKEKNEKSN